MSVVVNTEALRDTMAELLSMDELAERLGMDPVELRILNHADTDQEKGKPWSSKHLKECYERGAKIFGWSKRRAVPRANKEKSEWVGYGMATAIYPANKRDGSAAVRIYPDGRVIVRSATHDLGTGTYTTLAQVAADALGIPVSLATRFCRRQASPEARRRAPVSDRWCTKRR